MSDKLERVTVDTLVKPEANSLLEARELIKNHPEIRQIFVDFKKQDGAVQGLADALFTDLAQYLESDDVLWDTCMYLAEEYFQQGDNILIVSSDTGQSIARVTEEQIYQPPPVPREGSSELATPLPRLKPEIEAALVKGHYLKNKEAEVLAKVSQRVRSTALLQEVGDPRLLVVTRNGRKQLADRLKGELPGIFDTYTGVSRNLMSMCVFCPEGEVPQDECDHVTFTLTARVVTPIVDALATNVRYDAYGLLKRRTAGQWVRGLAEVISSLASHREPEQAQLKDAPEGLWIANPEVTKLLGLSLNRVIPVEGVCSTLLQKPPSAYISIHSDSYNCQSRELLEKWEVGSEVKGELYIRRDSVQSYEFTDLPEVEHIAEVVN